MHGVSSMSLINCCANKSTDWSRLLNGTRRRTKTNLRISRTNQSEAIKKMKFLAGKSLFTINMQSSFLFSHFDAWWKGDIGKWRYLEVSRHACNLFRRSLTSAFRESSVCKVFSPRTFCNFIASWIRTKFIGSPRHPSRISQLIPSPAMTRTQCLASVHLRVEMNKELWSTKHSKIKRNGEWNVLWLQHTPQIYFYHHKLEQQFVSAIGKKKKNIWGDQSGLNVPDAVRSTRAPHQKKLSDKR